VVQLEVEIVDDQASIETSVPDEFARWRHGLAFGIAYACERSVALRRKAARVRVTDVEWHNPVDTTEIVMAFVAANALWNALGETQAAAPTLNAKTGAFTFRG